MKAVTLHAARDLRIDEAEVPAAGPGEVEVRVGAGGICGSDLHYFQDGGFGAIRVREPMVLGHEIAGVVAAVGAGVSRVRVGDVVAVDPRQRRSGHGQHHPAAALAAARLPAGPPTGCAPAAVHRGAARPSGGGVFVIKFSLLTCV